MIRDRTVIYIGCLGPPVLHNHPGTTLKRTMVRTALIAVFNASLNKSRNPVLY